MCIVILFLFFMFVSMKKYTLWLFLLLWVLSWCSLLSSPNSDATILPTSWEVVSWSSQEVIWFAEQILTYLKTKDIIALSQVISSSWLLVSPYEHIDVVSGVVLTRENLTDLFVNNATWERWTYDGSWEPIRLPFSEYFSKFIYDVDYSSWALVSVNTPVQRWNLVVNVFDVFSWNTIVEYYFSWFEEKYEWMDWKWLFLVIESVGEDLFLKAIVHEQRTI